MTKSDLRPSREAILGHWQDYAGKVHYYSSRETIAMFDGEKCLGDFAYEIVQEVPLELWISIKLQCEGSEALRTLRIDFKRMGFMETFLLHGYTINNVMLYVDEQRAP